MMSADRGEVPRANFGADSFLSNACFDRDGPYNRDDALLALIGLRERFLSRGFVLNTSDVNRGKPVAFELHLNARSPTSAAPAYLLMLETPLIHPRNDVRAIGAAYRRVFTWNDELVARNGFVKINFPNPLTIPEVDGFTHRDGFCCVIAGNKAAAILDPRELYSERVRAIRWFEQNAPQDFDLYGTGWDLPPARPGLIGKVERRLWRYASRFLRQQPFTSYRGKVDRKRDVLRHTRFSICYENARDMPGYITEKIFDCFFAGCVPVYWGANNIADHIPADCYIDRRQFADTAAVHAHLKAMDETTYRSYQQRIASFLASDAARPFGNEFFAETIVSTIVKDLGCVE